MANTAQGEAAAADSNVSHERQLVAKVVSVFLFGLGLAVAWKIVALHRYYLSAGEDNALLAAVAAAGSIFAGSVCVVLILASLALVAIGRPQPVTQAVSLVAWAATIWVSAGFVALVAADVYQFEWRHFVLMHLSWCALGIIRSQSFSEARAVAIAGLSLAPMFNVAVVVAAAGRNISFSIIETLVAFASAAAMTGALPMLVAAILAAAAPTAPPIVRMLKSAIGLSIAVALGSFVTSVGFDTERGAFDETTVLFMQITAAVNGLPVLFGALALALYAEKKTTPSRGNRNESITATWLLGALFFLPVVFVALINHARLEARLDAEPGNDGRASLLQERVSRWRSASVWVTLALFVLAIAV